VDDIFTPGEKKRVMLVVMAHPDDESFGIGGTLALYARKGVAIHLICLTDGAAGTVDPDLLKNHETIAGLRSDELTCAANALGLTSFKLGWYRDSGMPGTPDNQHPQALINQPVEAVAARLVHEIRRLRPQVIVTHDPKGGYLHPDHIATHKAVFRAFQTTNDPEEYPSEPLPPFRPTKLYYPVFSFPKKWIQLYIRISQFFGGDLRHFGRNNDIDLIELMEELDFPIHARIDVRSVLQVRNAASECHASQLPSGPPNRGFLSLLFRFMAGKESFVRAYPLPTNNLMEKDLFEGIA